MNLRYEGGLLPPQIAELVKWSVGAVNVQLTKTRKLLKDCVRKKMAMEGA
jgi:DNA-directed RNA polymerase specialized sigma24 family protein